MVPHDINDRIVTRYFGFEPEACESTTGYITMHIDDMIICRRCELFITCSMLHTVRLVKRSGRRGRSSRARARIKRFLGLCPDTMSPRPRDLNTTIYVDVDSEPGYDEDVAIQVAWTRSEDVPSE